MAEFPKLTAKEAGELLNLSAKTMRKMAVEGKICAYRVNNQYRFKESDIQQYAENNLVSKGISKTDRRLVNFALSLRKQKKGDSEMRKSNLPHYLNLGNYGYRLRKYPPNKGNPYGKESWAIWYFDENGKRIEKIIRLASSAEETFDILMVERRKALEKQYSCPHCGTSLIDANPVFVKKMTLAEFSVEFFEAHDKKNKQGDLSIWKKHLKPHFGEKELEKISLKDIDVYVRLKKKEGLKCGTINQHLTLLRKMLYKAKKYEHIKEVIDISEAILKETDRREGKVMSDEHFWLIYDKALEYMQKMMYVARLTTDRGYELRTLKKDCVKLNGADSYFIITAEFDKVRKGKKCVITEEIRPIFEELMKDGNGCEYVFTHKDQPIKKNRFNNDWNKAVIAAGFDPIVDKETGRKRCFYGFHDLRTTGITIMGHNGEVGFKTVQQVAGHIDPKTTQGYMKDDFEKQKEAAKTLTLNGKETQ